MDRRSQALVLLAAHMWLAAFGCSDRVEVGYNGAGGAPAVSGTAGTAGTAGAAGIGGSAGAPPCVRTECRGKLYACGNCMDDDEDGRSDAADLDCLGPCDDSEDSFSRGAPSTSCRQDCYFDRNSGLGNDCVWTHECDPQEPNPACSYDENTTSMGGKTCADARSSQGDACRAACLPLTPNGCDCFGCCELPAGSGTFVWLGSNANGTNTCDASNVADPEACRRCTPVPSCWNACDRCEVCVGRSGPAPECGGNPSPCANGFEACAPTTGCGGGGYCITGCCVPPPR